MVSYKAPVDDVRFVLREVIGFDKITEIPAYEEATPDLVDAIIEEAAKICENEFFPLNQSGDHEGCTYENGVVRTPKGFKEAYQKFVEGGWGATAGDPEYAGQGLPKTLNYVMHEFMAASNLSFNIYPGLTWGAVASINQYASKELKQTYLSKLNEGSWTGTMCLTESHCGTDLGLIKTKAIPQEDGSYTVTGSKIFISSGEHDLAENIIHLVLAKLPDAPQGTKGISMFLIPKFLPNEDGSIGPRNGVRCGSIEEKMGIKASSTCVINFDDAKGFLVGELNQGMEAMFTMMNFERLGVGLQGLGVAEIAYQNALEYAKDRLQGRSLSGTKSPEKPADSIIVHPDVRKNLLNIKSFVEGARAFAYLASYHLDISRKHPDPLVKKESEDFAALVTPVIKALFTDYGFDSANTALQIYGGHGYIKEWGIEQFVRDSRIAQVYEGTNGIQALDLVGRKLGEGTGRLLRTFFHPLDQFLKENENNPILKDLIDPMTKAFTKLQQATGLIAQKGMKDPEEAGAAATDYLKLFGLVALGYMWLRMAKVSYEKLATGAENKKFYMSKIKTAHFYMYKVLPDVGSSFIRIATGAKPIMSFEEDEF